MHGDEPPDSDSQGADPSGVSRQILETLPDALIVADMSGSIRLLNRQAEAMFGYDAGELIGAQVEVLVPEAVRAVHQAHRQAYFHDPRTRPMGGDLDLAGRRKDGTEFPADISLSALQTPGGLLVSAVVRDVTDRVRALAEREELVGELRLAQLAQSQRIESLGQLTGGIAHDFNNLLAVILNYSSFVLEDIDDQDEIRASVKAIREAAQRAADLTRKLLIFGRRAIVTPQVMDLNILLSELETLLGRALGEHVDVQTRLEPGLWMIKADPGSLEQAVMNLAINARDAMPDGGVLTIETANVDLVENVPASLGDLQPGRYVRIRVGDTGVGMSDEAMSRAFEPFFTTKPMALASGLGLATVFGIITQAGGHVHLESAPGTGTVVDIYVPATDEEVATPIPAPRPGSEPGGGELILVVEDEDALRDIACRILRRNGYSVIAAAGGPEAMTLAEHHDGPIDLVLTDVVMPQMSGRTLAIALRELRPDIRILYMSGYPEDFISRELGDPRPVIVRKPFTEPALLEKLREMLDAASGGAQTGSNVRE